MSDEEAPAAIAPASGPRSEFGRYLRNHAGGLAATVHDASAADQAAVAGSTKDRHVVAEYPRAAGSTFRVVHDPLAHPPYGLHRVYVGEACVGQQLSFPSRDDCVRMDRPVRYGPSEWAPDAERARAARSGAAGHMRAVRLNGGRGEYRRGKPRDEDAAYENRRNAGWPGTLGTIGSHGVPIPGGPRKAGRT